MERETALAILQQHASELRSLGVVSAYLLGSVARDEATPLSDVDIAIRLDPGVRGFYAFGALDRVKSRLREVLKVEVDVIPEPSAGPLKGSLERDRFVVFS